MPEEGDGNNAAGAALSGGQRGRRVASSTVHPSLGLSQNTARARARAGIPNHIPIDFHAEKVCLFYLSPSLSLSLSLSPSFSFIVFRQSQIHSAEREAKNFPRFTSSRSSPRPPSVSPFALSLARICSMHAFSLRSSRWMKFYTFRSRRRAISFARPDLSFVRSFLPSSDVSEP